MKVSLVSTTLVDDDINTQIRNIENILMKNNSNLYIFGEAYLQGFNGLSWNYEKDIEKAVSIQSKEIRKIKELANHYNSALSFCFYERDHQDIYCTNIFINEDGEILNQYRRQSIGWKENYDSKNYKEGDRFKTFEYKGKKFATAICGDLWTRSLVEELKDLSKNIDYLLWPLFIDYSIQEWNTSAKSDYINQLKDIHCPVLMVNGYSQTSKGGCYVFDKGEISEELALGNVGILTIEID